MSASVDEPADAAARVGIVVCRGCCCGSTEKRPDVDHGARLALVEDFARNHPAGLSVRTSLCLGPCEHADLFVVLPSPAGRRAGGRPVWLGMVDDHALLRVLTWAAAGGPGIAPLTDDLHLHQVGRPQKDSEPEDVDA